MTNAPFDVLYLEEGVERLPFTHKVLSRLPGVPVERVDSAEDIQERLARTEADVFGAGKRRLFLSRFRGDFLKKCPGISPGMVCCNYYVVNLIKNCVYDCSYCFLQDFLSNNPVLTAFANPEDLVRELEATFRTHPERSFRVGTGELTDSLALEEVLPYAEVLVPLFNRYPNAVLELKTKSDIVAPLLALPDPTNVIVSWSLNPPGVAELEEKGTPGPHARLAAARKCFEAGYRVGFHFDPVILHPGWEKTYAQLVDDLFDSVPPEGIEWISLGSFRYRRGLKPVIRDRHPETRLFDSEHVPAEDGKFRYLRPLREKAYNTLRRMVQDKSGAVPVYMCMESKEVWEGVTGHTPRADEKLDVFFDL
ncbi:MAG: radical SAM protein [Nitrospina sp.]|nr:radical SAM protein [Nitrospina sp.]